MVDVLAFAVLWILLTIWFDPEKIGRLLARGRREYDRHMEESDGKVP